MKFLPMKTLVSSQNNVHETFGMLSGIQLLCSSGERKCTEGETKVSSRCIAHLTCEARGPWACSVYVKMYTYVVLYIIVKYPLF